MAITADMVKKLREATGAGMLDCKKALEEENGDMEKAKDFLRKKGLSKAAKKADRVAAEGLIATINDGKKAVVVEINSETDFVAKNDQFQKLVVDIAKTAFDKNADLEAVKAEKNDTIVNAIASIGENISIRRMDKVEADTVVDYMHSAIVIDENKDGIKIGKIGVLVALKGDAEKAEEVGKNIAMHIAAASPICMNIDEVSEDIINREKDIAKEKAVASGKPENVIEKMVEGAIRKFYEDVVLMEQFFIMDTNKKIKDVLKESGVELLSYSRYALGEGIEKEECDFAAEVMAAAQGK